jgi:hypothetical protein
MAKVLRAIESFAFTGKNGVPRVIHVGELVDARDEAYRGKAHLFEPVEVAAARPGLRRAGLVEEATAEPNRKRSVGRPRGRR